tara:strand:+ start:56575 stop:58026 length:1452 start_codon:yes stop_codon:yes gene_type:complete
MNLSYVFRNFLGSSPSWYKFTILFFLAVNPVAFSIDPYIAGWLVVAEFIFTLAMALKCYPLLPGGLIAIESIAIGMTKTDHVYHEILANFEVISLLMFMVAGIYFMQDLLFTLFSNLFLKIRSKTLLSVLFLLSSAFLSAFLDALTVMAVIITVAYSFFAIYNKYDPDEKVDSPDDIEFKGFLRNILMHSGIGTALGGVATMVGEPQNLIIAHKAGWTFGQFIQQMAHISVPSLIAGVIVCFLLEKFKVKQFGFGYQLSDRVINILKTTLAEEKKTHCETRNTKLTLQGLVGIILIASLSLHIAEVGLIGLMIIILLTSLTGVNEEHDIGKAFQDAMPFTALICVFFTIVAVIIDQKLFAPVMNMALEMEGDAQLSFFFIANGILSMVSDNVFVGSVYINEVAALLKDGTITREQFDGLAIAINAGTNLPSIATPNGQAAFLFLLTSRVAPYIYLSYGRMVLMALPYTIVISVVAYLSVMYLG